MTREPPVVRALDADQTHPYRQTELLAEMNKRLAGKVKVNGFDIQCVRQAHRFSELKVFKAEQ